VPGHQRKVTNAVSMKKMRGEVTNARSEMKKKEAGGV
jgi:hypothetical protein